MKPFDGNGGEARRQVIDGYEAAAEAYRDARAGGSTAILQSLLDGLAPGSHILDAGCGPGVPMAAAMASDHHVTGVDISPRQIELARQHVPDGEFIQGDLTVMTFPEATFDACLMLYALFHIPRNEQEPFLTRLHGWIRPGGRLLLSVAIHDEPGYTEEDFFGATMYWSNFPKPEMVRMLGRCGFTVLDEIGIGHGYDRRDLPDEHHALLLAERN